MVYLILGSKTDFLVILSSSNISTTVISNPSFIKLLIYLLFLSNFIKIYLYSSNAIFILLLLFIDSLLITWTLVIKHKNPSKSIVKPKINPVSIIYFPWISTNILHIKFDNIFETFVGNL